MANRTQNEELKGYKLTSARKLRDLRAEGITDEDKLLAAYDKRGGAIWDERGKVPQGTFAKEWEFNREGYTSKKDGRRYESDGHVPLKRKVAEEEEAAEEAPKEMTKDEIKAELDKRGVNYDGRMSKNDLQALLNE